tara:strand:- start:13 stop:174 length:162 start_codon:yes stop_codon:yes gene_type:complete
MSTKAVYDLIQCISKGEINLDICELSEQGKIKGLELIDKKSTSSTEVAFGKLV